MTPYIQSTLPKQVQLLDVGDVGDVGAVVTARRLAQVAA